MKLFTIKASLTHVWDVFLLSLAHVAQTSPPHVLQLYVRHHVSSQLVDLNQTPLEAS